MRTGEATNPCGLSPTSAVRLPIPRGASPTDIARAQLFALRFIETPKAIRRLLYEGLSHPIRCCEFEQNDFDARLLSSPAWTHRHLPFSLSDPKIEELTPSGTGVSPVPAPDDPNYFRANLKLRATALLRATYSSPGSPPAVCLIRLISDTPPQYPRLWLIDAITPDDSG